MTKIALTATLFTTFLPLGALAQDAVVGQPPVLSVTQAYARSSNPQAGAVFMTIANAGSVECTLAAVTADGFARTAVHTSRDEGGVMKMVPLDGLTVPAGGSHELKRGGDHIMLMGARAPVLQGQEVALKLDFGSCGTLPLTVTIDNRAGPAMGMGAMDAGMSHGQAGMNGAAGHGHDHAAHN